MLSFLQLPTRFNAQQMQQEVNALAEMNWLSHYNKKYYEGDWTVISLRSADGRANNIYSLHASASLTGKAAYQDTPLLDQCPYIKEVLSYFECEKTMVRLMKLNAGAVIKPHKDQDMNFEEGEVRFHIPVYTNELVSFFIEDERIPMQEGECWYLNLSLEHRVNNAGQTDRVHLVIDCMVNDWVKEKFSEPGLRRKEYKARPAMERYSSQERQQIIAELQRMNTPAAMNVLSKMNAGNE